MFMDLSDIDETAQAKVGTEIWTVKSDKALHSKGTKMSIVGPRPALPREVEQYSAYQAQRLFITPGLTCYWQIQPNRNDISFDEWVEMDIQYIRERSFLVDWKIIFKTIIAVLTKQGR